MSPAQILNKPLMLGVAFVQGLLLLWLHLASKHEVWPEQADSALFACYTIAIAIPWILLLGLQASGNGPLYKGLGVFTVLLAGLGIYTGNQAPDIEHFHYPNLIMPFVLTILVASFKVLMYLQHGYKRQPLDYSRLFLLSWRNFLSLGLSLLFTLCCWGVLMLWAALFKAIGITFFDNIFSQSWFYYPVLATANGFGMILFRQQSGIIDTITRIQQALMKYLLLALVFISSLFLITLPFTGLAPLWQSGGSGLIIAMQGLMLFFLNSVYQDKADERPYGLWLHRFIYLGIALLPIYSLISIYGMSLRVGQYGWTLDRLWATLLIGIFALFSLGYLWGIVRLKDHWLQQLSWVNVRMGWVVMAVAMLVNSPLLDFRKISSHSQLQRFMNSEKKLEDLDVNYFRHHLAKPGHQALMTLKTEFKDSNPQLVFAIDKALKPLGRTQAFSEQEIEKAISLINTQWPPGLQKEISQFAKKNYWAFELNSRLYLYQVDLNSDGNGEYILINQRKNRRRLQMFYKLDDSWRRLELRSRYYSSGKLPSPSVDNIQVLEPRWKALKIGEAIYQVQQSGIELPPRGDAILSSEGAAKGSAR